MNQEEREALIQQAIQRLVAVLHQPTNAEQMMIRTTLTGYGVAMFAAGRRRSEEWIGRILASLPIPLLITRTLPEGEGTQEPVLAYHWHTQDGEGDGVTFAYALEQALLAVLHRQEQQP